MYVYLQNYLYLRCFGTSTCTTKLGNKLMPRHITFVYGTIYAKFLFCLLMNSNEVIIDTCKQKNIKID